VKIILLPDSNIYSFLRMSNGEFRQGCHSRNKYGAVRVIQALPVGMEVSPVLAVSTNAAIALLLPRTTIALVSSMRRHRAPADTLRRGGGDGWPRH
jgi:hypothetical protein